MERYILVSEESHDFFVRCMAKFDYYLPLVYEECFSANKIRPAVKQEIGRFLDIELRADAEPYYVKQSPAKLDRVVLNYAQACQALERLGRARYVQR